MKCTICCGRGFIVLPIYPDGKETPIPIEHLRHGLRQFPCPECGRYVPVETLAACNHVDDIRYGSRAERAEAIHHSTFAAAHAIAEKLLQLNAFGVEVNDMPENLTTRVDVRLTYVPAESRNHLERMQREEEKRRRHRFRLDRPEFGPRTDVQRYRDTLDALQYIVPNPAKMEPK